MTTGRVLSVDYIEEKWGAPAWQIVTDFDPGPTPDGLKPCAFWIPHAATPPARGVQVSWGPHHAWWGDPRVTVAKIGDTFDPADPALFTG